jgi:hypothetical protein
MLLKQGTKIDGFSAAILSKLPDGGANVIMLLPEVLSYQDRFGNIGKATR